MWAVSHCRRAAAGTVLALTPPEREPVTNSIVDQCRVALADRYKVTAWRHDEYAVSPEGVECIEFVGTVQIGDEGRNY